MVSIWNNAIRSPILPKKRKKNIPAKTMVIIIDIIGVQQKFVLNLTQLRRLVRLLPA